MRVCFRVFGLFMFACVLVLRVAVYAFAIVCCKVAPPISQLCRLHVCLAFVLLYFVVFVCFSCWGIVYVFGSVCSKVAFHMRRVCRLNVCFDFVFWFVCLFYV